MDEKDKRLLGFIFFVIIIGMIFLVSLLSFDTVDASHKGVRVRFGEIKGTMDPGIRFTGPFVDVFQYDLRLRKMNIDMLSSQSAVDKDGQSVFANIEINYRINPIAVQKLYSEVGKDELLSDGESSLSYTLNIKGIVKEGFKSVTSGYTSLEIFQKRPEIKEKAIEKIKENFPSDYFILENVIISNLDFNEAFKNAIEQKKVAEEMAKAKSAEVTVAEAQAKIAAAQAEGAKQVKMKQAEANAYEIERIAEAEATALRMKKQELSELMIQNNWIDKWDGTLPYMVTGDSGVLLNIPGVN